MAVQCLHAIATHEELPLLSLVAERPERLDEAKDIGAIVDRLGVGMSCGICYRVVYKKMLGTQLALMKNNHNLYWACFFFSPQQWLPCCHVFAGFMYIFGNLDQRASKKK